MATVAQEITALRYDLMDEDSTQYSDALLLSYYNRAYRALSAVLGSIRSDRVFADDTLTLSSGSSTITLPDDFSTPILVQINNDTLVKKDPETIRRLLQQNNSGTPSNYGIMGSNFIFDREAGADTSVYVQYNTGVTTDLTTGSAMPYSDAHNDSLRGAVAMMAKNRNERAIAGDYALHQFFRSAEIGIVLGRSKKKSFNLGF